MTQPMELLVVDDEWSALMACSLALRAAGLGAVTTCEDPRDALRQVKERTFALALLDLSMPGMSGEDLLEQIRLERPGMPVVILTAFNDAETAMRCMRAGAQDYLVKPVDKDRLVTTVRRVLEAHSLLQENLRLKDHLLGRRDVEHSAFQPILTRDEGMQAIFHYAQAIAESPEPVLITGETGTGKDLMARAIHELSGRTGAFVAVNVAGLDEQMFNDVLFGHAKGAFTSAVDAREGLLQKAAGGTLFLDEIGDVALSLQSKLLRVMECGEYYAAGADALRRSDARILVATNRDAMELCRSGKMRRDLFYRLDVHHIHLPPLRDRGDDVRLLVHAYAQSAAVALGRPVPRIAPAAEALLAGYDWPGNIRELRAVMTDAVGRATGGELELDGLRAKLHNGPGGGVETAVDPWPVSPALPTIREATDRLVREALKQAGGNQRKAARILGISQPALSKRLKSRERGGAAGGIA
jgi:two-component system, NtrC family, nitrogen regulation response regulator GlnG